MNEVTPLPSPLQVQGRGDSRSQERPTGQRDKEEGGSERRAVTVRIPERSPTDALSGRESGLTSLGSSVTREPDQLTSGSDADMSAAAKLAGAASNPAVDWHAIPWPKVSRTVRRLQARSVKAVREGKGHKVKALVYLLTHSFGGRALAVLRVVSNSGARTPGVDGVGWNTPESKSAACNTLHRHGYRPQPLRRVYIPKSNGQQRPLGIPMVRAYCVSSQ